MLAQGIGGRHGPAATLTVVLGVTRENSALPKRNLETSARLFKHGNDSEVDVQQAKSQYLSTLATIPQIAGNLRQTRNALSVLLVGPPGPQAEMAAGRERTPRTEPAIVVDMSAEMRRRRPDVRAPRCAWRLNRR